MKIKVTKDERISRLCNFWIRLGPWCREMQAWLKRRDALRPAEMIFNKRCRISFDPEQEHEAHFEGLLVIFWTFLPFSRAGLSGHTRKFYCPPIRNILNQVPGHVPKFSVNYKKTPCNCMCITCFSSFMSHQKAKPKFCSFTYRNKTSKFQWERNFLLNNEKKKEEEENLTNLNHLLFSLDSFELRAVHREDCKFPVSLGCGPVTKWGQHLSNCKKE